MIWIVYSLVFLAPGALESPRENSLVRRYYNILQAICLTDSTFFISQGRSVIWLILWKLWRKAGLSGNGWICENIFVPKYKMMTVIWPEAVSDLKSDFSIFTDHCLAWDWGDADLDRGRNYNSSKNTKSEAVGLCPALVGLRSLVRRWHRQYKPLSFSSVIDASAHWHDHHWS